MAQDRGPWPLLSSLPPCRCWADESSRIVRSCRCGRISEANGARYETLLVALPQATQMHRFTAGSDELKLPAEGVLLGEGLSDTLGIAIGDPVTITQSQSGIRIEKPEGQLGRRAYEPGRISQSINCRVWLRRPG
jgi:hypothetical protein